ncbi:Transcriptional regulator, TetR family [Modestobacter italicus]|uniref:Transcriptional regulator, TetR family n=1 Tax=Modestobacter italicus (strain DSM 44449 / CECT 9708 / BC 501) TaxID=2732864 RepID=I4F0U3_MODI5|nr:TetR/AcrR family transcriptional regulator [Modestobacter marinus]CCH89256.1 Transcriptional regulator, TetR family [Modestobacter marinus]
MLIDDGYAGVTVDGVAATAGVGRATIYRRWSTMPDLVAEALRDLGSSSIETPDTGSLEEDALVLLRWLIGAVNGPLGTVTLSLPRDFGALSAFSTGPLEAWKSAFARTWDRWTPCNGDRDTFIRGSAVADAASDPVVHQWLFSDQIVPTALADEVLKCVISPLTSPTPQLATWINRREQLHRTC